MNALETKITQLERRINELEGRVAGVPVRFAVGGGGGGSLNLPANPRRWDVLICVDDVGTLAWGRPRFTETGDNIEGGD